MIQTALSFLTVALLWGGTNPFIKRGTKGINQVQSDSKIKQFLLELWFLVTNWKYIVPFGLNQLGSIFYVVTLQSSALSLAVPVTNSLTFIITAIVGRFLGEKNLSTRSYFGIGLVLIGTTLCVIDKIYPINFI